MSYDPTRELYDDYNAAFAKYWHTKTGQTLTVQQSNGGSGKQARAVIDGLAADVVTLALAYDIDAISQKAKLLPPNWQSRLPNDSTPYTSTIVFLVHRGNPKNIHDWNDLVRPGVSVITPNPKTSGGARWNFLAAWAYALAQRGGSDVLPKPSSPSSTRTFRCSIRAPVVPRLRSSSAASAMWKSLGRTTRFLAVEKLGPGKFQIVRPSLSILAEPPVALVDSVVDKKGTRAVAQAYLEHLYTPEGQTIIAHHYFRPRLAAVAKHYAWQFPAMKMVTIQKFGGWDKAQATFFADGGVFDQIYQPSQ